MSDEVAVMDDQTGIPEESAANVREGTFSLNPPQQYRHTVLDRFPHDPGAYTQGLVFEDGFLYEGTGLYGRSSLRKVDLTTGMVLQRRDLPASHFGEGITIFGNRIIQLTWRSHVGFVYDKDTFALLSQFQYPTEGWGLTHDGEHLILSDGTATLHFLDPNTFEEVHRLSVFDAAGPVVYINELEYIKGYIYANIYLTDRIAIIHPRTGAVTAWINLAGLGPHAAQTGYVLNGIAYDAQGDRLFVTGKMWPELSQIELVIPASGDLVRDDHVDLADFAVLAAAWRNNDGDAQWNPLCDLSRLPDGVVDPLDLAALVEYWLRDPGLASAMQIPDSGAREQEQEQEQEQASQAEQAKPKSSKSTGAQQVPSEPASLPKSDRVQEGAIPDPPQGGKPGHPPKSDHGAGHGPPRTTEGVRGPTHNARPPSVSRPRARRAERLDASRIGDVLGWCNPMAVDFGRGMYEAITGHAPPADLTAAPESVRGDVGVWVHYWVTEVERLCPAGRLREFAERCYRDVCKKRKVRGIISLGRVARGKSDDPDKPGIVPGILAAMGKTD